MGQTDTMYYLIEFCKKNNHQLCGIPTKDA